MAPTTPSTDDRLNHIEERLDAIEDKLDERFDKLSAEIEKSNDKFEIYRQANQSLVSLAFGLIASATVGLVVSLIFKR